MSSASGWKQRVHSRARIHAIDAARKASISASNNNPSSVLIVCWTGCASAASLTGSLHTHVGRDARLHPKGPASLSPLSIRCPHENECVNSQSMPPAPPVGHSETSHGSALGRRSPLPFFALVLALSLPFWLVGALTRRQLIPTLPVSALMAICPLLAALILVERDIGPGAAIALLKRSYDYTRIAGYIWYAPIVLLMPCVAVVSYTVLLFMDVPVPVLHVSVPAVAVMITVFFAGALGEELGWSGYITDPIQARWGALHGGLLLGVVWAAWHVVPYMQGGRSADWIAWYCLFTVATRVLMVWIFNNTSKSVFGAALFHTSINVSWFLFPNSGSHFDPRVAALITTLLAGIVVVVSGPRTLVRSRGNE